MKNFADEGVKGSIKAYKIAEDFDRALSTILVGNNIVNIAAASISAKLATDLIGGNAGILVSTFGMTFLILTFGEIVGKRACRAVFTVHIRDSLSANRLTDNLNPIS